MPSCSSVKCSSKTGDKDATLFSFHYEFHNEEKIEDREFIFVNSLDIAEMNSFAYLVWLFCLRKTFQSHSHCNECKSFYIDEEKSTSDRTSLISLRNYTPSNGYTFFLYNRFF
uniref:Uncharacterized protein n=1 Tax=Lepeophtheirus salmonis TaxID=72036 RepID=A0A0K2SVF9_LEPSM